jgi:hypothetical protein
VFLGDRDGNHDLARFGPTTRMALALNRKVNIGR